MPFLVAVQLNEHSGWGERCRKKTQHDVRTWLILARHGVQGGAAQPSKTGNQTPLASPTTPTELDRATAGGTNRGSLLYVQ